MSGPSWRDDPRTWALFGTAFDKLEGVERAELTRRMLRRLLETYNLPTVLTLLEHVTGTPLVHVLDAEQTKP